MSSRAVWERSSADHAVRLIADQAGLGSQSAIRSGDAIEFSPIADSSEQLRPHTLDDREAEIATPVVPNDPTVREAARAAQAEMAKHAPIDTWPDWNDLPAYRPGNASFRPAIDDPDTRARLRPLFLRTLREGSVPNEEVVQVSRDPEGTQDEAKADTDDAEYAHTHKLIPRLIWLGFAREAGKGHWR